MKLPFSLYKLSYIAYRKGLSNAIVISLGNIPIHSPMKKAQIYLAYMYALSKRIYKAVLWFQEEGVNKWKR
jgi:hypothetical protein